MNNNVKVGQRLKYYYYVLYRYTHVHIIPVSRRRQSRVAISINARIYAYFGFYYYFFFFFYPSLDTHQTVVKIIYDIIISLWCLLCAHIQGVPVQAIRPAVIYRAREDKYQIMVIFFLFVFLVRLVGNTNVRIIF